MNIKEFYKKQKQKEEEEFVGRTGLRIRHTIQRYNDGNGSEEVFSLQSSSRKEFFGVEFNGCIFYLFPKSNKESLILIYDDSFIPLIELMSSWSEARCNVYMKHVNLFKEAIDNANREDFSIHGIILDEDMLCFAKQIKFSILEKMKYGNFIDSYILKELTSLINFRNQCEREIVKFESFSSKDEAEIVLREGISFVKRGLKMKRYMDLFSN